MNAMPQLNEAETKFFESRGEELAPALSEGLPEKPEVQAETEGGAETAPQTDQPRESVVVEKDERQEKYVPLKALQQERAEKKQLRDELKA